MSGARGGTIVEEHLRATRSHRAWRTGSLLGIAASLVLVTACQSTTSPTPAAQGAAAAVKAQAPAPSITFAPASSTLNVRPDATVTVSAKDGTLTDVTVADEKGRQVPGSMSVDKTSWTADRRLRIATHYRVTAAAVNADGAAVSRSAYFATLKPKRTLTTSISPLSGATVGVGMPIIVRFNKKVTRRAAVEKNLEVASSKPIDGSWSWVSDDEVHFRPKTYWPAYDTITLHVNLRGVNAGRHLWSLEKRTVRFKTSASMVSVVDVARHTLTVYRNGDRARVIPVTTGKAGYLTRNGIKVILEKHTLKIMDATTIGIPKDSPDYYRLEVPYAMRVTWSGEFVHAAPWSTASQGDANVSHGCVGMSMSNAIWLFNLSHVGDIVKVVNSPRHLEPGNGYTDWNVSWKDWRAGSALTS